MPLVKLTPPPGVITEITDYQAGMRYTSADKVRFRFGQPEKIGGWAKRDAFNTSTFSGINRNIKPHRDTDGVKYIFYGLFFYCICRRCLLSAPTVLQERRRLYLSLAALPVHIPVVLPVQLEVPLQK